MIRAFLASVALLVAAPLAAQQVTPRTLEDRQVPLPDTSISTRVGERTLVTELRVPTGPGPHPVAIVIHGGCWVTKFADARYMRPLAEALRQAGIATLNISYRRADEPGGAWPGTFVDVASQASLVTALAPRYALDLRRVITIGHSAGAHFALWLASLPKLPTASAVRGPGPLIPVAASVALDGPGDLAAVNPAVAGICGTAVLDQLMGGTPASAPDRWRDASPASWLPLGVPQAMVRGGMDARLVSAAPDGTMLRYASRAKEVGDSAWVVNADTTSHFAMLDPQNPAFAVLLKAVRDALGAVRPRR